MKKILIIEDEYISAKVTELALTHNGYKVVGIVNNEADALNYTRQHNPDLLIVDVELAGQKDGIEIVEEIREFSEKPVVYFTNHNDPKTKERAKNTRHSDFISKTIHNFALLDTVKKIFTVNQKN